MNYLVILILAFLSGITTIIGVWLAIWCKNNNKAIVAGIGFSTGIMLLISFFELIPESIQVASVWSTIISVLAGIIVVAILDWIIPHAHLIKEGDNSKKHLYKIAYLVVFGLILHDFPEGFAMANSFVLNPSLGIMVAIAIALHNIPEEFAIATPIVLLENKKFLYKTAFISGLAEPAGAILGLIGISFFPQAIPIFLAFAAGVMIFVSCHELMPFAKRYNQPAYFIIGIILSIITFLVLRLAFS
jgi:ZIP family zinc transporter